MSKYTAVQFKMLGPGEMVAKVRTDAGPEKGKYFWRYKYPRKISRNQYETARMDFPIDRFKSLETFSKYPYVLKMQNKLK